MSPNEAMAKKHKGYEEKEEERRWTYGEKLKDEKIEVEEVINASNVQGKIHLYTRTQFSVDHGIGHPPPFRILLANRFQIFLPFWNP